MDSLRKINCLAAGSAKETRATLPTNCTAITLREANRFVIAVAITLRFAEAGKPDTSNKTVRGKSLDMTTPQKESKKKEKTHRTEPQGQAGWVTSRRKESNKKRGPKIRYHNPDLKNLSKSSCWNRSLECNWNPGTTGQNCVSNNQQVHRMRLGVA